MVTIISPPMTTDSTVCQKPFCYNDTRKILQEETEKTAKDDYSSGADSTTTTDEDDELLKISWDDDNFSLCLDSFPTCAAQIQKLTKSYPTTSSPLRRYWVGSTDASEAQVDDAHHTSEVEQVSEDEEGIKMGTQASQMDSTTTVYHHSQQQQQQQQQQLQDVNFVGPDDQQQGIMNSSAITCPTLPGIREEREELQAMMESTESPTTSTPLHSSSVPSTPTMGHKFMRTLSNTILKKKRVQTSPIKATDTTNVATLKKHFESFSGFPYNNSTTTLLNQPPSPQQHHGRHQQAKMQQEQQQEQQQQQPQKKQYQSSAATVNHKKGVEHISPLDSALVFKDKDDVFNTPVSARTNGRKMSNASSVHSNGSRFSVRYLQQQQQGESWKVTQTDKSSVRSMPNSPTSPTTAYYANAPVLSRHSPLSRLAPQQTTRPSSPLSPTGSTYSNSHYQQQQQHSYALQMQQQHLYHDPYQQQQPQEPVQQRLKSLLHHQSSVHPSTSSDNSYHTYHNPPSHQQQQYIETPYTQQQQQQEEPQRYELHDAPSPSSSSAPVQQLQHELHKARTSNSPAPSVANTNHSARSHQTVPVHTNNADRLIFYHEIYESRRPHSTYFGGHDAHRRYLVDHGTDTTLGNSQKKKGRKKNSKVSARKRTEDSKRSSIVGESAGNYQVYTRKKSVGLFTKLMKSLKHRFL